VQHIVDRRFNRARYDAEATVAAFTARLRDAVDLETVESGLLEGVDLALSPAHASLWIRPSGSARRGRRSAPASNESPRVASLVHTEPRGRWKMSVSWR
jgi:hypothetical protein